MMSTQWYDPVATLAYLAAATTQTRLMTNVYVPAYRHPLQVAKSFATLDALSGGRVILGVGAGHLEGEFAALGVPFAERGALLDEAIDGIVAAWTNEYPDLEGPRGRRTISVSGRDPYSGRVRRSGSVARVARVAQGRRTRRRLDPAGHAAQADGRRHRVRAGAPREGAPRCTDLDFGVHLRIRLRRRRRRGSSPTTPSPVRCSASSTS